MGALIGLVFGGYFCFLASYGIVAVARRRARGVPVAGTVVGAEALTFTEPVPGVGPGFRRRRALTWAVRFTPAGGDDVTVRAADLALGGAT